MSGRSRHLLCHAKECEERKLKWRRLELRWWSIAMSCMLKGREMKRLKVALTIEGESEPAACQPFAKTASPRIEIPQASSAYLVVWHALVQCQQIALHIHTHTHTHTHTNVLVHITAS